MIDKIKWSSRLKRASDGLASASDLVAGAFGTYLRQWLRFFWYGLIGLLAGAALPDRDPLRTAGIVLGVSFIAEFSVAIFAEFYDYKSALVALYVFCWWPWRHQVPSSPIGGGDLPVDSRASAREALLEKVR